MGLGDQLTYTGTQVNYYLICKRKLWLFSHHLEMEATSDLVTLGKVLQEESYSRKHKEVMIDERIRIDFLEKGGVIHEVKKSRKIEKAHYYQLLYYLYYLKQKGVENVTGELDYPLLKKKVGVELTGENEDELGKILADIANVLSQPAVPPKNEQKICKNCSYFELCWI